VGRDSIIKIRPTYGVIFGAWRERRLRQPMELDLSFAPQGMTVSFTPAEQYPQAEALSLSLRSLKKVIQENPYIIIPEMGQRLRGVGGQYHWVMPERQVLLWGYGSLKLYELLETLIAAGVVVPLPAPQLIFWPYAYPKLPVVDAFQEGLAIYKDLHWLPLCFEDASRVDLTEHEAQFYRSLFGSGSPHLQVIESSQGGNNHE